jgi:predicted nucleic acid-binding protein
MRQGRVGYRDSALLPMLGVQAADGPFVLDTNVFVNALSGRGPAELRTLLANLPLSLVSASTIAELNWTRGRLDPLHPQTAAVVSKVESLLARIVPAKILVPTAGQWSAAGELAGRAARAVAGEVRSISTAFDRIELMNDALTAIVAAAAGATVVTQDRDFDLLMQLETSLSVLFYG